MAAVTLMQVRRRKKLMFMKEDKDGGGMGNTRLEDKTMLSSH